MTSRTLARLIAKEALEHKAIDLVVLDLRKVGSFTDFFVICSGRSDTHVLSIAAAISEKMEKKKISSVGREGLKLGHWVVLDYGGVVCHVFYPAEREYYRLEKLWHDASQMKIRG